MRKIFERWHQTRTKLKDLSVGHISKKEDTRKDLNIPFRQNDSTPTVSFRLQIHPMFTFEDTFTRTRTVGIILKIKVFFGKVANFVRLFILILISPDKSVLFVLVGMSYRPKRVSCFTMCICQI